MVVLQLKVRVLVVVRHLLAIVDEVVVLIRLLTSVVVVAVVVRARPHTVRLDRALEVVRLQILRRVLLQVQRVQRKVIVVDRLPGPQRVSVQIRVRVTNRRVVRLKVLLTRTRRAREQREPTRVRLLHVLLARHSLRRPGLQPSHPRQQRNDHDLDEPQAELITPLEPIDLDVARPQRLLRRRRVVHVRRRQLDLGLRADADRAVDLQRRQQDEQQGGRDRDVDRVAQIVVPVDVVLGLVQDPLEQSVHVQVQDAKRQADEDVDDLADEGEHTGWDLDVGGAVSGGAAARQQLRLLVVELLGLVRLNQVQRYAQSHVNSRSDHDRERTEDGTVPVGFVVD
uniref:(northern house mosquito) hypothetical protein n=1 Tax=Culex pipiens TaxID=7175 RepID=A0A8D8ITF8_CULPI